VPLETVSHRPKWQQFSGCFFAYGTNKFVPTVLFTLCLAFPAHASQPDPVMMSNMSDLRARVANATDATNPASVDLSARAQLWIDFAQEEFIELDDTGVAEDAAQRALQIIDWLENKLPEAAPIPETLRGTMRVREDLWVRLANAQQHGKPCAAPYLAKAEIHLLWAAHEQPELGWRHAERYLQEAENLLGQAESCVVKPPAVVDLPPVEVPPVKLPPVPMVVVPPAIPEVSVPVAPALDKIPDAVHFASDRYNISPESEKVLQIVAHTLHTYPWLKLELGGHTDRRGKQSYNMKLSQRRVTAVYNRLLELGLPADRFITRAHGMTKLRMKNDDKLARALDRRVELIITNPNDPAAAIKVYSEEQKGDLQQ
jgi:outer membrane protein OmpA-like peptidoglycan-associated protein